MRGSDGSNHSSGDQRALQKGQSHNIDEKVTEGGAERVRKQNRQPEQQLNVPTNDGVNPRLPSRAYQIARDAISPDRRIVDPRR